jgi:hypothetical protein
MFGIDSRSYPNSINTMMSWMGPCSCRGEHSNNTHISFKHTCNHIWWDHGNPSLFPFTCWGWSPSFCWWFLSWHKGYFKLKGICLCFGSIVTFVFWWPLGYSVWAFMRLFFLKWFYEWLWPLFWGMWAHCLRSCSTFSIMFFFASQLLTLKK